MTRFRLTLAFIAATAVVAASAVALNLAPRPTNVAAPEPTPSASPRPLPSGSPTAQPAQDSQDESPLADGTKHESNGKVSYVAGAIHHDVSAPLRSMRSAKAIKPNDTYAELLEERREKSKPQINKALVKKSDPAVQSTKFGSLLGLPGTPTPAMPATSAGFNGLGSGFSGFSVQSAPPDTNMDVSSTQIVQVVNSSIVVLNKSGAVVSGGGPKYLNTLWSGFGGDCQDYNDGDPTVIFDRIANRWVIGQFAVSQNETKAGYLRPYLQCVAVSQTADATGAYYRYSFGYTFFNDYPKMSVWPDAYYTTFNAFTSGGAWAGGYICAYDRQKMLAGDASAQQKCIQGSADGGILVASADTGSVPTPGTDAYAMSLSGTSTSQLELWRLSVNWTGTPSLNVTSTSFISIPAFNWSCPNTYGWDCVPQKSTANVLDTLGDRLMYRFSYRKTRAGQETFVASHSADVNGTTAVRWYELRPSGTTLIKYQAQTYQPDSSHRWMPSIAMDRMGNIGMVYSKSSSTEYPSIVAAGRLVTDTINTLGQGETTVKAGNGSQTGTLTRWGDYAAMVVDPADDCTFWSSTEYLSSSGTFNWKTWISKFKFANCVSDATSYTFTGPSSGGVGVQSSNFTVTTNGPFNGTITVTPSGAGVDPTPIALVFDGSTNSKTFKITPTEVGTVTFTVADSGTLADPTPPTYLSQVLATAFTLSGPTGGLKGQTSSAFTVTPNAVFTGTITIARSGGGLTGNTVLTFNGSAAPQTFTITPSTVGTVTLSPSNSGGLTNASPLSYSVTTPQPAISSITTSGTVGSIITISGSGLSDIARVKIGGIGASSFTITSSSSISAVVAPGTTVGKVTVIDIVGQSATSVADFSVTYASSTLTTISPTTGRLGTSLVVSGTNLNNVTGVTVGGVSTPRYTVSGNKLYVSIPSGVSIGSGKTVVVSTPNGPVTSTGTFTMQAGTTVPRISNLSVFSGGRGASVTITGSNFASADAVFFNGVSAPFVVLSDNTILAAVPATATGNVTVRTPGGTSSGVSFTYQSTAVTPTISTSSGVSPTAATIGNVITVTGTNLAGVTSISFNGTPVLTFSVISATQLTFVVPDGATSGSFTITTTGGSVTYSKTVTIY